MNFKAPIIGIHACVRLQSAHYAMPPTIFVYF